MAKFLIVDDSPTEIHALSKMLERHGHSVVAAKTAEEGLARAQADSPDLILMDIVMPGMNGFQATRRLQDHPQTRGIPVVIISTKDQQTDQIWGKRQGARDYLIKPFSEKTLIDTVKAILG